VQTVTCIREVIYRCCEIKLIVKIGEYILNRNVMCLNVT